MHRNIIVSEIYSRFNVNEPDFLIYCLSADKQLTELGKRRLFESIWTPP